MQFTMIHAFASAEWTSFYISSFVIIMSMSATLFFAASMVNTAFSHNS